MGNEERRGSFVRWQAITIAQLSNATNLVLGFAVATLGFQVTLLLGDKFNPASWQKCTFGTSMVLLVLSTALGLLCVVNRLVDFRATQRAARIREEGKAAEEIEAYRTRYESLGKRTWLLFWWQIGTFGAGILLAVVGVAASVSAKFV